MIARGRPRDRRGRPIEEKPEYREDIARIALEAQVRALEKDVYAKYSAATATKEKAKFLPSIITIAEARDILAGVPPIDYKALFKSKKK